VEGRIGDIYIKYAFCAYVTYFLTPTRVFGFWCLLWFLADLSEKVARDIERLNKIEHGEKYVLQIAEVQAVVQQITLIIHQEIADGRVVERVANRLQLLKW
jgi:hypothetical protein